MKPSLLPLLAILSIAIAISAGAAHAQSSAASGASGDTFLEPYESVELSSVNTGIIESLGVKQGEYVKKDQVLMTLNSDVIQAQYQVAKARAENQGRIMTAQAEYDQQSYRYNMLASLKSRGASNTAEIKKEYAMLKAAEGNLITAQEEQKIAHLDAQRILAELSERTITSPIEGYVVSITRDVGEPVGPGQKGNDPDAADYLVRIVQVSRLKATTFLPYQSIKNLNVGSKLKVTGSDMGWSTQGTIEFISPIIFAATGLVEVGIVIENYDLNFKSGAPAKVIVP